MNSVCALFYLFYRVFPRAKSEHTSRRGFIKFEIAAVGGHPLGGLEEIVRGESDRPNRMYSDMKCIFCEYLRPFAARVEHAIARARDGKARTFMASQACTDTFAFE